MGEAYPELRQKAERIAETLRDEEERFARTLDTGMGILKDVMAEAVRDRSGQIDGETAFLLYDTYGFPLDLTQDIARENDLSVDLDGFAEALAEQQERGRASGKFGQQVQISSRAIQDLTPTEFLGYECLEADDARIVAIVAESGGQVGDTGTLQSGPSNFEVEDTIKVAGVFHGHSGTVAAGRLRVGETVTAQVDAPRRQAIVLHHSATHLMHAALKQVLGDHVEQRGSLVAPDHLRFDFTHPRAMTADELTEVERLVNREIRVNPPSEVRIMDFEDALETGATALFGEKYGDRVRVLRFGEFSVELCGGTHVDRVGDIGQFKIIEESAIAAGIRRIVAVAGEAAVERIQAIDDRLKDLARILKVAPEAVSDRLSQILERSKALEAVSDRLSQILERSKALEKEVEELKSRIASASGDELAGQTFEVNGIKVLAARLDDVEPKALRDTVDRLKNRLGRSVVVIGGAGGGKVRLAAGISADLISRIQAGDLVN
jgi:alanyl-tRNA synthetase